MSAQRAFEQIIGDALYHFQTRKRKQHHQITLDLKQAHRDIKHWLKPLKNYTKTYELDVKAITRTYFKWLEARIDLAHQTLFQSLKELKMMQLSKGMAGYQAQAFNVYYLKSTYTLKPPRLARFLWVPKRLYKTYQYQPKDYFKTQQFFHQFNSIVDRHRKNIMFKNGRIKRGAFRHFYSALYYHFVKKGNVHDYHVTKPLHARFQTNGGVYGWELNGRMVYIGRTLNFDQRMKQHARCFMVGCPEKKYQTITSHQLHVHLLAITNNEDAQKVLETVYYQRYQPQLNAVKTLSLEKIVADARLNTIWQETLKSDHALYEAEEEDTKAHINLLYSQAHAKLEKFLYDRKKSA